MISLVFIKKIELGPRQMTFGFEDRVSENLDSVFLFVEKKCINF
jgi:hypothetical protein